MDKDKFVSAIDTLKLYQRAELLDEKGRRLIKKLYVDPLPNDHILKTVLRPHSTFLIGRKGTGKSTIFQRAQEEIDNNKNATWAYIDIKSLYESSTTDIVGAFPEHSSLSIEAVRKIYVFRSFIVALIREIKSQLKARLDSSMWNQVKEAFSDSLIDLFEKLDDLLDDVKSDEFLNITGNYKSDLSTNEYKKETSRIGIDGDLGTNSSIKLIAELVAEIEKKKSENFAQVFVRVFRIKDVILRLKEILSTLKVNHLYIFIDDFSELPKNEMEEVVDSILSPFNNWSEEFIKLKVAVYPGRLYFGDIDRSKIDEVYLDTFRAYGRIDVNDMEMKAIDFTKRLVIRRLEHFCGDNKNDFFDLESDDIWRSLFYSSLGNPRILGYVLFYCYELSIIYDEEIKQKTIQEASRRYFEEKIGYYFTLNKFLHETFQERSSIFSLKELFEEIVKRARELRGYKESKVLSELPGRPPTSHFHISTKYDDILSSLELNFFISKYYEMKDRDGREVSVYSLNYGLCQQQAINFGKPKEKREHRLYFVERVFDYTPIILSYIKVNQEIICDKCGTKHDHDKLPAIQAFDMLCIACKEGKCKVVNLSKKYEELINKISKESLLPRTELGILKTLHDERRVMFAKEIASELDCSYQLIGRRGKNLADKNLVGRDENNQGRRVFEIGQNAEEIYFSEGSDADFDFEE